MSYFIDYVKTYANVNRKGRELQLYAEQFDRHLIEDESSLLALKCDIEHRIMMMNEKYPRSRPVRLNVFSDGRTHVRGTRVYMNLHNKKHGTYVDSARSEERRVGKECRL